MERYCSGITIINTMSFGGVERRENCLRLRRGEKSQRGRSFEALEKHFPDEIYV
jgi:hypothetical protein